MAQPIAKSPSSAIIPPIGTKITEVANSSTTSLQSTFKPQSLSAPRIRILLAPYMSSFIVPLHKVETWDLLHEALKSLFGLDIFNNSSIRITDQHGNSILPPVWKDLLEPDMTIIVDTCSLQAENSPVTFKFEPLPAFRHSSPPASPAFTSRMSEDSCLYDSASTYMGQLGVIIGQAVPMPPTPVGTPNVHGRRTSRDMIKEWSKKVDEEEKRDASVEMFSGLSSGHSSKPSEKEQTTSTEKPVQQENAPKPKSFKSSISRFARAVLCVLTYSKDSPHSKSSDKRKRAPTPSDKPRRTITMDAIEKQPPKSQFNTRVYHIPSERRTASISRRRGIPSLAPVATPAITTTPTRNRAEVRRSKSLSHLKLPSFSSTRATTSSPLPTPTPSIKFRPRSRSFTSTRNSSKLSIISPPIPPRRPSLELGTNAQYKSLALDKAQITEMFKELDGETLAGRSRSGTGDTSSTLAVSAAPSQELQKPLPKLPYKFSAFPAPSPPRSPIIGFGDDYVVYEEVGRPATAITRRITKVTLRKVASTDFTPVKPRRVKTVQTF
ncbi:uncharacterized protein H6S33_006626 [Morchella sextelata]|uniref:uncharacterized protein n=1 Tax=Morchella sextelata TaxID=1174677 RepID=UPI001D051F0D|nr:uncharacterized protein H6S33_006626 [Morchella sextelata]KAH0604249.1 hypothetical protein H6S33_006626 [Morchella sextelata]